MTRPCAHAQNFQWHMSSHPAQKKAQIINRVMIEAIVRPTTRQLSVFHACLEKLCTMVGE